MWGRLGTFQQPPSSVLSWAKSFTTLYKLCTTISWHSQPLPMCTKSISSHSVKHYAEPIHYHHQHTHTHTPKLLRSRLLHDSQPSKQTLLSAQKTLVLDSHISSKDGPYHHLSGWNRLHLDTTPFSEITPLLFGGGTLFLRSFLNVLCAF